MVTAPTLPSAPPPAGAGCALASPGPAGRGGRGGQRSAGPVTCRGDRQRPRLGTTRGDLTRATAAAMATSIAVERWSLAGRDDSHHVLHYHQCHEKPEQITVSRRSEEGHNQVSSKRTVASYQSGDGWSNFRSGHTSPACHSQAHCKFCSVQSTQCTKLCVHTLSTQSSHPLALSIHTRKGGGELSQRGAPAPHPTRGAARRRNFYSMHNMR